MLFFVKMAYKEVRSCGQQLIMLTCWDKAKAGNHPKRSSEF